MELNSNLKNTNNNIVTSKSSKVQEITKQIEDLKIGDKVNYIMSKGFDQLKKIVRFLKKNNLDQELALLELQEKALQFLNKKKKKIATSSSSNTSSDNEKTKKPEDITPEVMLNQTVEKIKKLRQAKREEKYKQLFPEDTEFDWEKFKLTKQKFKDSDLWKKIQKNREELYKKFFPSDTEFDWNKFKQFKQEEKKKNREFKETNKDGKDISEFVKMKKEKKQAMYKEFFPQDTEFNQEKFRAKKQELKKLFKEKKDQDKDNKETKEVCPRRLEKFFRAFPEETKFDWQKFRQFKQEKRLNKENKENKCEKLEKTVKTDKNDFKKIREEKKRQLYKEFFPNDTEFDWDKFKTFKKSTKKEFKMKQALDNKFECPKFKKIQEFRQQLYKLAFPDDTEFNWCKFRQYKREMKCDSKNNTDSEEKETKRECHFKRQKREELYKQAFPNDSKFDWEKFMSFFNKDDKETKEDKENLVKDWSKDITSVYLDGNNMLYVENMIRKVQLQCPNNAEKILALLAGKFGLRANLKNLTLIYDSTKNIFTKNVEGLELKVCSARPDFNTSDDALVVWSEGKSVQDFNSTLFVTTDRGLKIRLREKGAKLIMNSGRWFKIARDFIGNNDVDEIIAKNSK